MRFQSTLPAGEATLDQVTFLPHPCISIHASRGGSDSRAFSYVIVYKLFQSTLPAGEATLRLKCLQVFVQTISIHASRGGSDLRRRSLFLPGGIISIHASRGGSDTFFVVKREPADFISIHASRGGSDSWVIHSHMDFDFISIHASRGGSDSTVKLSPDDRTSRHGFREPGFLRFRHRQISCLFLLGAWGSRL